MKVAIVHDALTQRGGAERVVLSLHKLFPEAPIFTSVFDPSGTYSAFSGAVVRTSFLQRLPHRGGWVRAWLPVYPVAFETLRLTEYDLVISSSSHFAHGVRTDGALHICYCHTPPRWLYLTERYLAEGGPLPGWARTPMSPLLAVLRRWDRRAAARPDVYVANSMLVADRIKRIYGRESRVIHPPVATECFASGRMTEAEESPFFLVVSRLLPYKRVDLAVRVCSKIGAHLVVVGEGPARRHLESIAGPTVEFRGAVDGATLVSLLSGCRALIQSGEEDFGIGLLEANAAGRPVVAYGSGGSVETVVDGKTGVLFSSQTEEDLAQALEAAGKIDWDEELLRAHAAGFGEDRFHAEMLELIDHENGHGSDRGGHPWA